MRGEYVPPRIEDPKLHKYPGQWDGQTGQQANRLEALEKMFPGSLSPEGQAPTREPGNGAGERWHLANGNQARPGTGASAFSLAPSRALDLMREQLESAACDADRSPPF
jgi:hypothetical protein